MSNYDADAQSMGFRSSEDFAEYLRGQSAPKAQPAQAVLVLTDAEIDEAADDDDPDCDYVCGFYNGARWAEQAVRAKMGAGVPMTEAQILEMALQEEFLLVCDDLDALTEIIRAAEAHHGITS